MVPLSENVHPPMLMNTLSVGLIFFSAAVSPNIDVGVSESMGTTSYVSGVKNANAKFKCVSAPTCHCHLVSWSSKAERDPPKK